MDHTKKEYQMWVVELDAKNKWFKYFDYISRFQITKYLGKVQNEAACVLHMSAKDFPVKYVLFVNTANNVQVEKIKEKWLALKEPQALIFPGVSRALNDIAFINPQKIHFLQS